MKFKFTVYQIMLALIGCSISVTSLAQQIVVSNDNQLTQKEKEAGWELLFDGKTSTGWKGANKDSFPEQGWEVKDGVLSVLGTKGGDIITEKMYGDFDLKVEFRAKEQEANSGIKYYVLENEYRPGETLGLEFQTAYSYKEGGTYPGGPYPKGALGSLYEIIAAEGKLIHPNPIGEWNQARIISKNNKVEHWLNGYKILEYKRGGKAFREGVANSKFKDIKNFGEVEKGHILLQDHDYFVSFKNIKIRKL